MVDVFNFLWSHPSLTAILVFAILFVVIQLRGGRRDVDQQKDALYGAAQGYTGRKLERKWKDDKEYGLLSIALILLLIFLGYRFLKMIGFI